MVIKKNKRWKLAQAAEIRWWEWYLKGKDPEQYLARKRAYFGAVLDKIQMNIRPDDRLLDAGCGPAGIFLLFPDRRIDAIDPLLEQYQKKLPNFRPGDFPNVAFSGLSLEKLNRVGHYDKVFCLNVINHVASFSRALDHLVRSVRPGGQILLSVDAHNHSFFKHLFRLIPGDILHPHQFDLKEYKQALTRRGCLLEREFRWRKGIIFDHWILLFTQPAEHRL